MKINRFYLLLCLIFNTLVAAKTEGPATIEANQEAIESPAVKACSKKLFFASNDIGSAELTFKNIEDVFYGKSTNMFSANAGDQLFSVKTSLDTIIKIQLNSGIDFKAGLRTKASCGNETSTITTTSSGFKIGGAVTGSHDHYVARLLPWFREVWFDVSLNKFMNLDDSLEHNLKFGAFPFILGRGIALGSAYSAAPGFLGFCTCSVIDQFAFGQLIYGDIIKDQLAYNVYFGLLENTSDRFGRVNLMVYENEIGRKDSPERGFGIINFVAATNVKWTVSDGSSASFGKLDVEPYAMYNGAPEQKVEFQGDAGSKLATFGLCIDYTGPVCEFGFDIAMNTGRQEVRGWSRNEQENFIDEDAINKNRYTYIRQDNPSTGTLALVTKDVKKIVDGVGSAQGVEQNGKLIGTVGAVNYYNDINRFRPAYINKYKGIMVVADGSWSLREDKKLKLVGTVAWATGDENPNLDLDNQNDSTVDGDYQGFIGLQEIYSGKRVPSFFLIGSNSAVRPLSSPSYTTIGTSRTPGFATDISGFTNLVFIGGGIDSNFNISNKSTIFKANVLSYWQDMATKKYDAVNQVGLDEYANKHLGVEFNTELRMVMLKELSAYFMLGVFVPGQHYEDIKGKPLNPRQLKALNRLDSDGATINGLPVIGTTTAFLINFGLELSF